MWILSKITKYREVKLSENSLAQKFKIMLGTVRVRPAILAQTEDTDLPWFHALQQRPKTVA